MIAHVHTFQNCQCLTEDLLSSKTGEVDGRCIVYVDQDTGEVWRYPMPIDVAKTIGQRLMGIGKAEIATPQQMQEIVKRNGKGS